MAVSVQWVSVRASGVSGLLGLDAKFQIYMVRIGLPKHNVTEVMDKEGIALAKSQRQKAQLVLEDAAPWSCCHTTPHHSSVLRAHQLSYTPPQHHSHRLLLIALRLRDGSS